MTTTYIAGYDGSPESRAAVELAARLARSADARVLAVHVYPFPSATYWIPAAALHQEGLEAAVPEEAEALLDELDVEGVDRRLIQADSPARGLHDLAEEIGAGLIAVGATHRGPFGRLAPGSVGMHLLHGAPCPVLVTPDEGEAPPLRTIGVAFDGRDESLIAVRAADDIAARAGADLIVIGARQPALVGAPLGVPAAFELSEEDQRRFEAVIERAAAQTSAKASHRMLTGPPAQEIAEASADLDLIVTGSRGYGAIRGVVLGSVSRHLVDHSACPVLAVPRPGKT